MAIIIDSNAGVVGDLQRLADPNADRLLFWDDSAAMAGFLQVSNGLTLSGTTLSADAGAIDHDGLSNFVAAEHVNHNSVTFTAGLGLAGGGNLSASRVFSISWPNLPIMPSPIDGTNDFLVLYDSSADQHFRVPAGDIASSSSGFVTTSRTFSAGAGLTGGGDMTTNRTFALDATDVRNVDHSNITFSAGVGLTGGGNLVGNRTFALDTSNTRNLDLYTLSLPAALPISAIRGQPRLRGAAVSFRLGGILT